MANRVRILSIDGGGIRGIIPGQVLVELERRLQKRTGNQDARIADYFDLVAGTSTGGILTCLFLCPDEEKPDRPRFSAEQAVDLYLENGDEIFDVPLGHKVRTLGGVRDEKYPAETLEKLLFDYLGDVELRQLLRPCMVTAYDVKRRRTMFFNKTDAEKHAGRNFYVRDVARATSAAPTFFECAHVASMSQVRYPLVDGGVFANNPSLCAYAEARKFPGAPTAKDMVILSLGTGEQKQAFHYSEVKDWGLAQWAVPVLEIMMSGVSETVDYQLKQIFQTTAVPDHYVRLQTELSDRNAGLDNAQRENVRELQEIGQALAEDRGDELDRIVELCCVQ